jgi:hypothetical protein
MKSKLKEFEDAIKVIKREANFAPNIPLKLNIERDKRNIETDSDEACKKFEQAARDIEKGKDSLSVEVEKTDTALTLMSLFRLRWGSFK